MFYNVTFQVLTIGLTVIQILLLFILGRMLAIYSKFGNKYANSIRWLHQSGYVSMLLASCWSVAVPWFDRLALLLVLALSALISLSGVILTHFTTATQQLGPPFTYEVLSNQTVTLSSMFYLPTWTRVISYGADIETTLDSIINSPDNIPNMSSEDVYNAYTSDFVNICTVHIVFALPYPTAIFEPEGNCMQVKTSLLSGAITEDWNSGWVEVRPDGTVNLTFHGPTLVGATELSHMATLSYNGTNIMILDQSNLVLTLPANGTSSPPSTVATKSWTKNGAMMVLSMTTTRIYAGIDNLHQSLTAEFGNNSLFNNVERSIQQSTFVTNETYNILFAEARMNGTMFESAGCMSVHTIFFEKVTMNCYHVHLKVVVATVPEFERTQRTWLGNDMFSTLLSIKHVPQPGNSTLLDTEGITDKVADVLARLGCSAVMNWYNGSLMMHFNRQKILNGYEVPNWLVWSFGSFLAFFFMVALWTLRFEGKYSSSFFDLVQSSLVLKLEKENVSRIGPSDFKKGIRLGNGRLAFEENEDEPLAKNPEDDQFSSSTHLTSYQMVPTQSNDTEPLKGRYLYSTSPIAPAQSQDMEPLNGIYLTRLPRPQTTSISFESRKTRMQ